MRRKIEIHHITRGKPKRDNLTPKQGQTAREVFEIIGQHLAGPFEHFEFTFLCDSDPDSELAIWSNIALSMKKWRELHPNYTDQQEIKAYAEFLGISMGNDSKAEQELKDIYFSREK